MRLKFFSFVCLLFAAVPYAGATRQFQFLAGPVYTDLPPRDDSNQLAIVVELTPGLTPEAADFHLLVGEEVISAGQELVPFRQLGQGLALMICVDVSGTMKGSPLKDTKEALLSLIAQARPVDQIFLVTFADSAEPDVLFGDHRGQLKQAVIDMHTRGQKTRLYQALYDSLDRFRGADISKRRRVIVISDGKDEGSTANAENVIAKSKAYGIPIDTVGRGRIADQYAEGLRGLASKSGGHFVHARPDRLDLTDALNRIYSDLLEFRSLVVYFKYDWDDAGRTTQKALIQLQLSGETPLSVPIADKIPLRRSTLLARIYQAWLADYRQYWLLLLMVVLLGIGLLVLLWYRSGKESGSGQAPGNDISAKGADFSSGLIEETVTNVHFESGRPDSPPPKNTVVGDYYFPVPEPGQPTAILNGVRGPVEGRRCGIEKKTFHIGASRANDLNIAEDDYVSAEHAVISYEAGYLYIFDKGSRNRTFVNQNAVPETGLALRLGDRINIGTSTLEVIKSSF